MTLIPSEDGRSLLWDFTFCNALAQSHHAIAERGPGVVVNFAEDQYASLTPSYIFVPVCIESLGAWGDNAKVYIRKIGQRVQGSPDQLHSSFKDLHWMSRGAMLPQFLALSLP